MMKKTNVESFDLDHTQVKAPYIRAAGTVRGEHGDMIYKYDLRFKQPNKTHMDMKSLHSLEHLLADLLRNLLAGVIDFSPMGCQTGFYLSILNKSSTDEISIALEKALNDVLIANEVPACNERQCGWAANHSLQGAKELAKDMLAFKHTWENVFGE